ncbi:hypothetical protein BGZ91_008733 [Linnemannia elongata]|nr:hypothetical protein BGZ91_008733 [Linnemannia elongata]
MQDGETTTTTTVTEAAQEEKRLLVEKYQTSQDLHHQIYTTFSGLTSLRRLDFGYRRKRLLKPEGVGLDAACLAEAREGGGN